MVVFLFLSAVIFYKRKYDLPTCIQWNLLLVCIYTAYYEVVIYILNSDLNKIYRYAYNLIILLKITPKIYFAFIEENIFTE